MGKLKILTALLLAAALTACGDDSDVFYTTSYPVARDRDIRKPERTGKAGS